MNLVISKCVTAVKISNFNGHYLPNRSTLDIGVLGFFGIVSHKEHPPEVWTLPPVTPCIILIAFPLHCTNAPRSYVIRSLNFLFHITAPNGCHSRKNPVNSPAFHMTNTVMTQVTATFLATRLTAPLPTEIQIILSPRRSEPYYASSNTFLQKRLKQNSSKLYWRCERLLPELYSRRVTRLPV